MRKPSLILSAVAALSLHAANAFAQYEGERVIEEEIVLKDPTVAGGRLWAVGGSVEGWYVAGPYKSFDNSGNLVATGSIGGGMPGGNAFVGYDNLTMQFSYRGGTFGVRRTYVSDGRETVSTQKQTEFEATLRYLWKWKKHFNPYAIVGYNRTTLTETESIQTPGLVWAYNGSQSSGDGSAYESGLVGIGAVIPFNKYLGIRGDGRLMFTGGKYKRDDGRTATGSGVGGAATGTAYVNIIQGLNLQAGLKGLALNAGENVPRYNKIGLFGSIGYSYKF